MDELKCPACRSSDVGSIEPILNENTAAVAVGGGAITGAVLTATVVGALTGGVGAIIFGALYGGCLGGGTPLIAQAMSPDYRCNDCGKRFIDCRGEGWSEGGGG